MAKSSVNLSKNLNITCIVLSIIILVLICVALGLQLRNKETFEDGTTIPKDRICGSLTQLMSITQAYCSSKDNGDGKDKNGSKDKANGGN